MGNFKSNEGKSDVNLSLDNYIIQLKDYKEKAAKVFQMGGNNSYSVYVLSALQYLIDVAQGKNISNEEKAAALRSVEALTQNALNFHNNFGQFKESIEHKTQDSPVEVNKNDGPGLGQ